MAVEWEFLPIIIVAEEEPEPEPEPSPSPGSAVIAIPAINLKPPVGTDEDDSLYLDSGDDNGFLPLVLDEENDNGITPTFNFLPGYGLYYRLTGVDYNRLYTWKVGEDGVEKKFIIKSGAIPMATKRVTGYASGSTLYDIFRTEDGQVVNNTTYQYENWGDNSHTRADYAFDLTDMSGDLYVGDYPAGFPIGATLYRTTYLQAGANPADGDTIVLNPQRIEWTGESVIVEGEELSVTALCNLAFIKVGGAGKEIKLSSYFEVSNNALLCQQLWPQVRKEVLIRGSKEGVNWEESVKYASLGDALEDENIPDMAEWEYAFSLPADNLRVIAQISESDRAEEYKCEIMRGMLLTNDLTNNDGDSAYIKYVFDNDDVTTYSATLYAAMITKLAAEISPVVVDNKRRIELIDEYENLMLSLAGAKNQAEVYNDDKGRQNIKGARHRPYGRDT